MFGNMSAAEDAAGIGTKGKEVGRNLRCQFVSSKWFIHRHWLQPGRPTLFQSDDPERQ